MQPNYTQAPTAYTPSTNPTPAFGQSSAATASAQAAWNAQNLQGIQNGTVQALKVDGLYGPKTYAAFNANSTGPGIVGTADIHDQADRNSKDLDAHINGTVYNPINPGTGTPNNNGDRTNGQDMTDPALTGQSDPYLVALQGIADRSNDASKRLIATIAAKHQSEVNEVERNYDKYARGMELLGINNGQAQFTPEILKGQILEIKNQKLSKVHDLDQEMASAIADAEDARSQNDFKVLQEKMDYVRQLKQDRAQALKDLADSDTDAMRKAQFFGDTIYDSIRGLSGDQKTAALSALSSKLGIPVAYLIGAASSVAQDRIRSSGGGSAADRKSGVISALNSVFSDPSKKDSNGMPYVDQNGYIIPEQFKKLMKAAAEDGIDRKQFIDLYGDQIYVENASAYGLRPAEIKLLGGSEDGDDGLN